MNRDLLKRWLAWGLVAVVLVPLALAAVLGLGALLAALGDSAAAVVCGRVALALGVVLAVALMSTTAVNALVILAPRPPRRRRRPRERGAPTEVPGIPRA